MAQENQIPEHFAYSQLTPCKSRGRFPRAVYILALLAGIYLLTLSTSGIIFGVAVILYAVHHLFCSRNLQGACPNCRKAQSSIRPKSTPFSCKTCGHRLSIYGDKLADVSDEKTNITSKKEIKNFGSIDRDIKENLEFVKNRRLSQAVGGLACIAFLVWAFVGGGQDFINSHLANNISGQYELAKRHGNKMDMCVQAGATALSYMNAHDEKNYSYWKSIEEADCRAAGLR